MPHYTTHVMRPDGNSERYNSDSANPGEAAKKALAEYEKWVTGKIKTADQGREKRFWESMKIPRLIEVNDKTGYVVGKFGAKDV